MYININVGNCLHQHLNTLRQKLYGNVEFLLLTMFLLFSLSIFCCTGLYLFIFCGPPIIIRYVLPVWIVNFQFLIQLFRGPSLPGWLCSERPLAPLVIRPQGCIDEAEPWVFRVCSLFSFFLSTHNIHTNTFSTLVIQSYGLENPEK